MKKKISGLSKKKSRPKISTVIGWREWIALPELGINFIKTKVDTGARTSALHAFNIEHYQRGGEDWVRFTIHPLQRNNQVEHVCKCPLQEFRVVRNSGGYKEDRFVITTPITLGDQTWPIEITLTNRDEMGFRMLLGRTALRGRFMIDPAQSYCQGQPKSSNNILVRPKRKSFHKKKGKK